MMQPSSATSRRLKIEFAQSSDPGRDPNKQVNEDSCGYAETALGHLVVLCDGMGGHYGGKEASRTAIATIFEMFEKAPPGVGPGAALKAAIEEAARRVYRLGGPPENRTRPGSTCVAMLLHDRGVDVAHVGDSRAYVIRASQIYPLTRDHSMVQGMIDAGMLTEAQAIGHPDANKITRALGMKPEVEVEVRPEPMELFPGDLLLQSSDGLTDLALGADILGATRQALSSGPVDHACKMLVQLANDRGGHDNITVQMARVVEVGPRPVTTIPEAPVGAASPSARRPETLPMGGTPAPAQAAAYPMPQAGGPAPGGAMAPQQGAPNQGAGSGAPPAAYPGASRTGGQWGSVAPTSSDLAQGYVAPPMAQQAMAGPGPGAGPQGNAGQGHGPIPTVLEGGAAAGPRWTSGAYGAPLQQAPSQAPPGAPQANLSGYQMEGAGGLPLPPPSGSYGRTGTPPAPPYGPMQQAPSPSYPEAVQASRGGIVFVIIGLSAVIAILILVLVWALLLRT